MNADASASAAFRDEHGESAPSPRGTHGEERTDGGLVRSGPPFPTLRRPVYGHSSHQVARAALQKQIDQEPRATASPQSPQPRDTENRCG